MVDVVEISDCFRSDGQNDKRTETRDGQVQSEKRRAAVSVPPSCEEFCVMVWIYHADRQNVRCGNAEGIFVPVLSAASAAERD